jgi:alanyl-tRNA synthetase
MLLSKISRTLSMPAEQSPEIVAGLTEKNKSIEKERSRLAIELARREGRDLFLATAPDSDGLRRITQTGPIDDAMRSRAQGFTEGGRAQYLAVCEEPPSVLLAASKDSGVHAGDRVKEAVALAGGRGGGNPMLAQGSAPDLESLKAVIAALGA